ncbi:unnamed protein product [Acanthoscelides obtectus]|uniref:Uncharacterized protein n=1 Tax=Acanthoscelides obtectus TaxID=200917 RepID=A0A9P0PG53_ACAOB|nr:unnamed protein product [Acanthoscelides obtectus]CAK1641960.1 hypothetical protein AOBTE_LOCUS12758 [Acanthoscelides obtectus]
MCGYEKEQRRLWAPWEEVQNEDEAIDRDDSEEEEDEIDNASVCNDYPDLEQDDKVIGDQDDKAQAEDLATCRFFLGKNGMKWFKECPNGNLRTRSENIITHLPGVKNYAKMEETPLECFLLFIDGIIITHTVKNVNIRIIEKSEKWKNKGINPAEIKEVCGLLYLSGVF